MWNRAEEMFVGEQRRDNIDFSIDYNKEPPSSMPGAPMSSVMIGGVFRAGSALVA